MKGELILDTAQIGVWIRERRRDSGLTLERGREFHPSPLSIRLPLRVEEYAGIEVEAFFSTCFPRGPFVSLSRAHRRNCPWPSVRMVAFYSLWEMLQPPTS
jgi:hypothetical protein